MIGLLAWAEGCLSDRRELKVFTCTTPGRRVQRGRQWITDHPREWELEVQSKIRTFEPPYNNGRCLLVGRDREGIGAAMLYEKLDGWSQVELCYGAVAMRHRHCGGGVADEMYRETLAHITAGAMSDGVNLTNIIGYIHRDNRGSQRAARDAGLRQTGWDPEGLQVWGATLMLVEPDDSP